MSYSKFIRELDRGIEGRIVAYSRKDDTEDCLIHLRNLKQRILVHADVIEHRRDEAVRLLRAKIREGIESASLLVLSQDGENLIFSEETMEGEQGGAKEASERVVEGETEDL